VVDDISREHGYGWVRISCDAADCDERVETVSLPGQPWPYGWACDLTTGVAYYYCTAHADSAAG